MIEGMISMRKQWKKAFFVLFVFLLLLTGCGKEQEIATAGPAEGESDLAYIQSKGTLVAGITDFAPMDYRDRVEWKGFDAELAEAFAERIGVTLVLREIDWDDKTRLLENGEIDCIWNGMTLTPALEESISCSEPYLSNAQVIVIHEEALKQYQTIEECQHLLFAVEAGSAGEVLLRERKYRYTTCATQTAALQSVLDKKVDATVIDIIMAAYNTGEGQEYDELGIVVSLNDEKIGVGLRKDSDLTQEVNAFIQAAYEDGSINALAEKYGIENAVLE